jgi:outer membrane lipoprotein carrier protein
MSALIRKMIFKSCLVSLLSLIVVAAPQAQTPSTQKPNLDAITQFKSFLVNVKNAEGDFAQQQIRPPKQGETQAKVLRKSQGNFVFQRPGQFVWETKKPFEQKVIADGNQLLLWDKDLNQLTTRPAGQGLAASPAAILFGNTSVDEHFELIPGEDRGGVLWLELKPKVTGKGDVPYSRIGIGMKDGLPVGLELHDNFGTVVLINLSKIKTNITLGPQTFKFSPPTGAEVFKVK